MVAKPAIQRDRVSYYVSKPVIDAVERLTHEVALELGGKISKADIVDGLLVLGIRHRGQLVRELRKAREQGN